MRIVLDCNVLLVSIPRKSRYHRIFQLIRNGEIGLIISNEILTEYLEVIASKSSYESASNVIDMILSSQGTSRAEPFYKFNLITADADDNKYSDLAISSNADYLVTNDNHFNVLKATAFPKVTVITAEEFLSLLPTPGE